MKKLICSIVLCMSLVACGSGFFVGSGISEGTDVLSTAEAAGKHLESDGAGKATWETPPVGGDVTGPVSSVDGHVCSYSGATGKIIKDGGVVNIDGAIITGPTTGTTESLHFGSANAVVTSIRNTTFGMGAGASLTSGAGNNTFFGYNAGAGVTSRTRLVGIGAAALSSAAADDLIGIGASAGAGSSSFDSIYMGRSAGASMTGNDNIILAGDTAADNPLTSLSAASELAIGSQDAPITKAFFGEGHTSTSPQNLQFLASAGAGTDIVGGDWIFTSGRGTGAGIGGHFIWKTAPAGATGSAINGEIARLEITDEGLIKVSGDLAFQANGQGVVLVAPDAGCWELEVDNAGALTTSSVTCP